MLLATHHRAGESVAVACGTRLDTEGKLVIDWLAVHPPLPRTLKLVDIATNATLEVRSPAISKTEPHWLTNQTLEVINGKNHAQPNLEP